MSNIAVRFFNKEYTIPTDVVTYVGLVDFTNKVRDNLLLSFKNQIWPNVENLESDNFMIDAINQQVSKFISKLLENEIYDKTANDYLLNNKGFDLFLDTKKKVLNQIISIRKQKLETYRTGVQDAIYKKESSVTGLDFGILSSSFVNHMIYAYMDASKQTKQEQEALKVYNREIAELDKVAAEYDKQENSYILDNVIPAMNTVFTYFAYELLDRYVSDLIRVGKFDKAALDYINLERSNDLLKNLDLSNNKNAIIESAFVACPFNIAVYMQAMKCDLLDYDSFQTAKAFKQSDYILDFLKSELRDPADRNKMYFKLKSIELLALYTDTSIKDVTANMADFIVNAYSDTIALLSNRNKCEFFIKKATENEILANDKISREQANLIVNSIASANLWNKLINVCGHVDLQNRVLSLLPQEFDLKTKEEIDSYLRDKLYEALERTRLEIAKAIKVRKERDELERQEAERLKQKKIIKNTVIFSVIAVAIIIAVSLPSIIKNIKVSKRENFVDDKIQEVILPLEKEMEDATGVDVIIDYYFSLEEDWDYDREQWYEYTFSVSLPIFEEYRKSNSTSEQPLLEVMDVCKTLVEIYDDVYDELDFEFRHKDARIVMRFSGGNFGALKISDTSSHETFYYEEYGGERYLHSSETSYTLDEDYN